MVLALLPEINFKKLNYIFLKTNLLILHMKGGHHQQQLCIMFHSIGDRIRI